MSGILAHSAAPGGGCLRESSRFGGLGFLWWANLNSTLETLCGKGHTHTLLKRQRCELLQEELRCAGAWALIPVVGTHSAMIQAVALLPEGEASHRNRTDVEGPRPPSHE